MGTEKRSTITMTLFSVVLLLYSAWRTYDYMRNSLMDVEQLTAIIVASAFLFASEVGMLLWLHKGLPTATTQTQENTAQFLIWIDFIGAMFLNLADLIKHNTTYVIDMSWLDPVLFIAPWILIICNIGGYIIYHQADSQTLIDRMERTLEHKKVELEISARLAAVKEANRNKASLAKELAPTYYKEIVDEVEGRTFTRDMRRAKAKGKLSDNIPFYGGKDGGVGERKPIVDLSLLHIGRKKPTMQQLNSEAEDVTRKNGHRG